MRLFLEMVERVVNDAEAVGVWHRDVDNDSERLRFDGKQPHIEGPMVGRAEDQAIPRVVRARFTLGAKMGGVEKLRVIESANDSIRAVTLEDSEFEPLLPRSC